MWCPSRSSVGQAAVAGMLLFTAGTAEACLFPCLFGWGGYYGPPPMYAAPAYGAPAYAPSPCGPGGCSPCGPGGCSSYYGPTASCSNCCDTGCSPCSGTACAGGNCGVNYGSDLKPTPDQGRPERTYSEPGASEKPPTPADMEDDDFKEPLRNGSPSTEGAGTSGTGVADPFPAGSAAESAAPAAEPVPENILPDMSTLRVLPTRFRTDVHAQYRLPRVARLQIAPRTDWLPVAEGRLARR